MKKGDIVKGKAQDYLRGKRMKIRAVSKRTGLLTVELLEQAASYRPGVVINVMPYEVEKSK